MDRSTRASKTKVRCTSHRTYLATARRSLGPRSENFPITTRWLETPFAPNTVDPLEVV